MLASIGYAVAYTGVGIALLVLGFFVLDLLTPGNLGRHIAEHRSLNAAIAVGGGFLGQGAIVFASIWTNATSGFGRALLYTVVFGGPRGRAPGRGLRRARRAHPRAAGEHLMTAPSTPPAWSAPPCSWRSRRSSSPASGPDEEERLPGGNVSGAALGPSPATAAAHT